MEFSATTRPGASGRCASASASSCTYRRVCNLTAVTELVTGAAEAYALAHTTPAEGLLDEVASWTQRETSAPGMMSGLAEARLLEVLVVASGARRVLEIGTFTGYGALTMAAAVG